MQINFTKLYRLWYLLTVVSILGLFITFYAGYNPIFNSWKTPMFNLHTIFTGILLAAVITRVYMAINKINAVPLMHLIRAKSIPQALIAIGYIAMCSALLVTLVSEMYLLMSPSLGMTWIHELRNNTQPVFVTMVLVHVIYVAYRNIVKKSGTFMKLLKASNS
ncbi:MAG: hypothetical protein GQ474_01005 [Sulfurimonas sp.]|nr:hypothetical protein [Sulfurimonas sp.]